MSNKPSLLARIFGRSKHPVVASVATAALNQPLLVHPTMGEALIGAYLEGAVTSADTELQTTVLPAEKVAVINVSGGLVNRPMPGPSGGGPVSYAALRDAFDAAIEAPDVAAVVLRIDSPGGMAAGCFDLVDRVYAARSAKPIHALVDDMAYSAAFALASACDEVWVSRTGGVGSIGVVAYHYDWSAYDAKLGLKVVPIYAGEGKIDFSPHFPLDEKARERAQADIEMLYDMFVATVARNMGLSEESVRSLGAITLRGQAAVDAGLATRLGTWDDLLASLGAESTSAPAQAGDDGDDGTREDATAVVTEADAVEAVGTAQAEGAAPVAGAAPADVGAGAMPAAENPQGQVAALAVAVQACALPAEVGMALLARGPQCGESPQQAIEYARDVRDACAAAFRGAETLAPTFIKSNTELAVVRAQLLALKAEEGPAAQIVATLPASDAAKREAELTASLNPQTIYQKRGN